MHLLFTIIVVFLLFMILFITPKSKPIEPGSAYTRQESKRCDDMNTKVEKKIQDTKKKLNDLKADSRAIADRARYIRKLVKTNKSEIELDSQLRQIDSTVFKELFVKYPIKKLEKKTNTQVRKKDLKTTSNKDINRKSKQKPNKGLDENSNE